MCVVWFTICLPQVGYFFLTQTHLAFRNDDDDDHDDHDDDDDDDEDDDDDDDYDDYDDDAER